ncbi:hypothetical protein QL285_021155 [Trifolium repens]|nr:hypothetical protein QL285_021155 [Trifolium repens]
MSYDRCKSSSSFQVAQVNSAMHQRPLSSMWVSGDHASKTSSNPQTTSLVPKNTSFHCPPSSESLSCINHVALLYQQNYTLHASINHHISCIQIMHRSSIILHPL